MRGRLEANKNMKTNAAQVAHFLLNSRTETHVSDILSVSVLRTPELNQQVETLEGGTRPSPWSLSAAHLLPGSANLCLGELVLISWTPKGTMGMTDSYTAFLLVGV